MTLPAGTTAPATTRRVAVVSGGDWATSHTDRVQLDDSRDELVLQPVPDRAVDPWPPADAPPERAGLTFDGRGRLYRGSPERGQILCVAAGSRTPVDLLDGPEPPPADIVDPAAGPGAGVGFLGVGGDPRRPLRATALAADDDEHLFVLDAGTGALAVLDLTDGHLLRTIALDRVPVDLAADGTGAVVVVLPSRQRPLLRIDALGLPTEVTVDPRRLDGVPRSAVPSRAAVGPHGTIWLLLSADASPGTPPSSAWLVPVTGPLVTAVEVLGGRDLAVDGSGLVVVAGPAEHALRTWRPAGGTLQEGVPLVAAGYDGRGITRTPEGRIAYWNGRTRRTALPRRIRRERSGTVVTRALDGLVPRCHWGRVFVEACVPPDCRLLVAAATTDDTAPEPTTADVGDDALRPLHRRETGRELPWSPLATSDRYEVYEAPVVAPPGRFLTLRLQLAGPGEVTPRVRAVRVELPGSDLLDRLPRTYSRDPEAASFLGRFLALLDGPMSDIEARAVRRDLLLDPWSAPPEMLDWLGSLVGLTLDARWPDRVRRQMLAESAELYRTRGTVAGVQRMLEIYLECRVVVLEAFRMRGAPVAVGSVEGPPPAGAAVVGAGLRVVGGTLGTVDATESPADTSAGAPAGDAYRANAHRFTVLVTADLDDDRRAVLDDLLDLYRPAHTLVELCTTGDGMRVGVALHAGLSSVVGRSSGARSVTVGGPTALGGEGVLGHGRAGVRPGATRVGPGTAVDG